MVFGHLYRGQRVWLGHTLFHGELVPLAIEEREATYKNLSGNAGWRKGSRPLFSGQKARLRSRNKRKDLPVGRNHTHTHTEK